MENNKEGKEAERASLVLSTVFISGCELACDFQDTNLIVSLCYLKPFDDNKAIIIVANSTCRVITVCRMLHELFYLHYFLALYPKAPWLFAVITPILKMRKLRPRKLKELAHS